MVKTEQAPVPGLGIWIALMIAGGIMLLFISRLPSKEQQEKTAMQSWLLDKSALIDKKPLIVILGTSLTGSGLDSSIILEKAIRELAGREVSVIKIWKLDAQPGTFSALGKSVQQLRPAVVVTEGNMLFYAFSKKEGWPAYVQRFRDFISRKDNNYLPDERPLIVKRKMNELATFRDGLMDTTRLTAFRDLLKGWQRQGSRLILLNFPLEATLETRKWNSADTIAFYKNLAYLRQHCTIQYADPKMRLNEEYYTDYAHMNELGQKKQSLLFCKLVADQLKMP